MADFETHVDGLGDLYICRRKIPFNLALTDVLNSADELITLRDLAYIRIKEGSWGGPICQNITYVKEGALFAPRSANKRIWLRNSLVLDNPYEAVGAHMAKKDYFIPLPFNVEQYLEQLGKDDYFILTDTTPVPTNRLGEDARMQWAFRDLAQQYGEFLVDLDIKEFHIDMWNSNYGGLYGIYIERQSRPFASQLVSCRLGGDNATGIDATTNWLHDPEGFTVRGVRREPAEGSK